MAMELPDHQKKLTIILQFQSKLSSANKNIHNVYTLCLTKTKN